MLDNQGSFYEVWELEWVTAPIPSRLYHLEPVGMGTTLVESLTSYVARLAQAHHVYTRALVTDEILPSLKQSHLHQNGIPMYDHMTTFWKRSAILNGTSPTTSCWVDALEHLTRRHDLRFLTMLPWAQALSYRGCVRRTQAWCSVCYQEWREEKQTIYQPLLWGLEVIKVCPQHGIPLHTRCPYQDCGYVLSPLAPHLQLGYCSWCHRWLGVPLQKGDTGQSVSPIEREWQHWIIAAVGEMLAMAPQLKAAPRPEAFAGTIAAHLQQELGGNVSLFARKLQVHWRTAWEWSKGQQIPQLAALLHVCAYFGVTPVHFFKYLLETMPTLQPIGVRQATWEKAKKSYRKFDAEHLRSALDRVLQHEETFPPSMREVGRRIGYDASHLAKHFPEQCHAISARYRSFQQSQRLSRLQQTCSEIEQVARTLYEKKNRFPSERQVGKGIRKRGVLREYEVRAALKDTIRTIEGAV